MNSEPIFPQLQYNHPLIFNRGEHAIKFPPPSVFTVDHRLRRNVDFWILIYTQISNHEAVIHDSKYIDKIYETIRLDPDEDDSETLKKTKKKWKNVLLSLSVKSKKNEPPSTTEEALAYELFKDVDDPQKFVKASHRKRLRVQFGQRENFLMGLQDSGKFLRSMEEVFHREGLPLELTRLPFVESSFNVKARSKLGASGIWQFMPSTGKLFLKINDVIDERNDPLIATDAAAKLLKYNYEILGSWPLAVTAYNHGSYGIARAVRKVGSNDLEDLVSSYRSQSFGFASSNFFTELLAAIEVERNSEKYFGKIQLHSPQLFINFELPDPIDLRILTQHMNLDLDSLRTLNPGIRDSVFQGRRLLPKGFLIRLPAPEGIELETVYEKYLSHYQSIPAELKQKKVIRKSRSR